MLKEIINKIKLENFRKNYLKTKHSFITKHSSFDFNTLLDSDVYLGLGDYRGANIGSYSYVGSGLFQNCKIGKFCSIGQNVKVISGRHPLDRVSTSSAFIKDSQSLMKKRFKTKPYIENLFTINGYNVEIGNDVWIGNDVLIKGGVAIGDGAVVGMGSVVTKDVPPYAIVAGNPAKVIRYRFNDEVIKTFLKIRWWDFDDKSLDRYSELFDNPELFIKTFFANSK